MSPQRVTARRRKLRQVQVREAQRRRRERLRQQNQRFLQILVSNELHLRLSEEADEKNCTVQEITSQLLASALGTESLPQPGNVDEDVTHEISSGKESATVSRAPKTLTATSPNTERSSDLPVLHPLPNAPEVEALVVLSATEIAALYGMPEPTSTEPVELPPPHLEVLPAPTALNISNHIASESQIVSEVETQTKSAETCNLEDALAQPTKDELPVPTQKQFELF